MLGLRAGGALDSPLPVTAIGALVAAAFAAGAGGVAAAATPSGDLLLLAGIGVVLLFPLLQRLGKGTFDIFEPLTIFSVAFGIMFLARPVAMLATGSLAIERPGEPTYDLHPTFSLMLVAALIGAVAFQLGYGSGVGRGLGRRLPAPRSVWHADTAVALSLSLVAAGLGLFGVFVVRSGGYDMLLDLLAGRDPSQVELFRSSTAYLYYAFLLLIPAALVLVAAGAEKRRVVLIALAGPIAALVLLRTAPTGGRMVLLLLAGSLVTYYYLRTGKRPGLASAVLLLTVVFFGITFFRDVRTQSVREEQGVTSVLATSVSDPGDALRRLLLGGDTQMAEMFALEMQVVPSERPYQLGKATFGDLVTRPIPRVLWPEKPLSPREELIDRLWPTRYGAGVANPEFSPMAWFYLDAGLPGVFLGMFVFGLLFRAAFEFLQRHRSSTAAQVLYASLVPFMVIALRDSPTDTVVRMVFVTLPLVLILLIGSTSPRGGRELPTPPRSEEGAT